MKLTRTKTAVAAALIAGAASLTACSSSSYANYQSICYDPLTGFRIPDIQCAILGPGAAYWYVPYGQLAPAYGARPIYGTALAPSHARVVYGGAPAAGGKATPAKNAKTVTTSSSPKSTSHSTSSPKVSTKKTTSTKPRTTSRPKTRTAPRTHR